VTPNEKAFLDMVSVSEGTYGKGDNGYNVIVGGGLFDTYTDHPRRLVKLPGLGIESTAAGRYQLLERYFDYYKKLLNLPDFCPDCQDKIALQQIAEKGAINDINTGNIELAIKLCSGLWASLPGNDYGQHQNKLQALVDSYTQFGGQTNAID
jgi:muramidase (phage lysozyme)